MNNRLVRTLLVKPFLFLWLAEIFSQIAMNMANFILIIVAYELTKSNTAVSGIVLSYTIPAILFGILAGIMVDRWDKKKVLIFTNIFRFLLLIILTAFHTNIILIYFISFIFSLVTQFFIPAETPMIPVVVKKDLLFSANALFGIALYSSILIAYALSGVLILLFGQVNVLIVLSLLFLLASFFVSLIKVPNKIERNSHNNSGTNFSLLFLEIKNTINLMSRKREIFHALLLLTLSQVLILIVAVIGPGFAASVLGINVESFPLFFVTPAAIGMVIGAVILVKFFHKSSKIFLANTGVFLSGIGILLMPYGSKVASRDIVATINSYLPNFLSIDIMHIMVSLAFILGFANALVFVPSNTLIQEETSETMRGKVYGVLNTLVGAFSLIPIIIVGGLADLFGVSTVLTLIGIILLVFGLIRVLLLRKA